MTNIHRRALLLGAAATALAAHSSARAASTEPLTPAQWAAVREGNHILMMRHTRAPGTFDPPGFELRQCSTQRNLSAEGRDQAKAIGAYLREQNVSVGTVWSSQWCRCLDTARLAFGAQQVVEQPWLNSPRGGSTQTNAQALAGLRAEAAKLAQRKGKTVPNRVWVTHQFVIQDLVGVTVQEGDVLVLKEPAAGSTTPQVLGLIRMP